MTPRIEHVIINDVTYERRFYTMSDTEYGKLILCEQADGSVASIPPSPANKDFVDFNEWWATVPVELHPW